VFPPARNHECCITHRVRLCIGLKPYTPSVELIPKAVVAGLFIQAQPLSTGPATLLVQTSGSTVTQETINRIWSDVVKDYTYRSLQLNPTGSGGAFLGTGPDDAVIINPPLVQVRDLVDLKGVAGSAEKVESIFKSIAHHISGAVPISLGVKLVYHAPAPGRDAAGFLLAQLLSEHEGLRQLAGAMEYRGTVKYVFQGEKHTFALTLEPLLADSAFIYVDLDAQYPGPVDLNRVKDQVTEAETFITSQVRSFLERAAEEWS
jgi:hypothetical protein